MNERSKVSHLTGTKNAKHHLQPYASDGVLKGKAMRNESTIRIRVSKDFKKKLDEIMDVLKNKELEAFQDRK